MSGSLISAVTIHESTVRETDSHIKKRRGRGKAKPKPDGPIETLRVHPQVWAEVLRQADGDPRRIVIVSATECHIR